MAPQGRRQEGLPKGGSRGWGWKASLGNDCSNKAPQYLPPEGVLRSPLHCSLALGHLFQVRLVPPLGGLGPGTSSTSEQESPGTLSICSAEPVSHLGALSSCLQNE